MSIRRLYKAAFRRLIDVEATSCVYWDLAHNIISYVVTVNVHNDFDSFESFPLKISSVNVTKSAGNCRKLQIWSHILKKSLMENIFCAVRQALLREILLIVFMCFYFHVLMGN